MNTRVRLCGAANKGLVAAAFSAVALLSCASVVAACTATMGPITITPSSGAAGSAVKMSASGLKGLPAKYEIHFSVAAGGATDCMSFASDVQVLKTNIATNRYGKFNVPVTIPSNAAMGTHTVCGMEVYPMKASTGTTHVTFTVT